jgi:hypothetical protein
MTMNEHNRSNKIYLFEMKNNKKKLAYGKSPEDALAVLRLRLTPREMDQIKTDAFRRIKRTDLLNHVDKLG